MPPERSTFPARAPSRDARDPADPTRHAASQRTFRHDL